MHMACYVKQRSGSRFDLHIVLINGQQSPSLIWFDIHMLHIHLSPVLILTCSVHDTAMLEDQLHIVMLAQH